MPNAAHKSQVPAQESAAAYEKQLFTHRESAHAFDLGSDVVADTAAGETVELKPMYRLSVHEIYTKIAENFKALSAAEQAEKLAEMERKLGVELHDASGAEVDSTEAKPKHAAPKVEASELAPTTEREKYNRLLHQLAEDIFNALRGAQESLAIIKPESIGDRIHRHLNKPGDANFLVARGEGDNLLRSLRDQDADFRVLKHNKYGFVMENKEIGFRALFVFQERIDDDGNLIAPDIEETEIETNSARAKERTPEKTVGNVAGSTTAANERATVPAEDHVPDNVAQFAVATQRQANQTRGQSRPMASFGDAANASVHDKAS